MTLSVQPLLAAAAAASSDLFYGDDLIMNSLLLAESARVVRDGATRPLSCLPGAITERERASGPAQPSQAPVTTDDWLVTRRARRDMLLQLIRTRCVLSVKPTLLAYAVSLRC